MDSSLTDKSGTAESITPESILDYWYSDKLKKHWFNSTENLDKEIKDLGKYLESSRPTAVNLKFAVDLVLEKTNTRACSRNRSIIRITLIFLLYFLPVFIIGTSMLYCFPKSLAFLL